jgi:hypothetical protein
VKRLQWANLTAALAIALFGLYAWHQAHTKHVLVAHKGWSSTRANGTAVGGETDLFFSKTTHPHAVLAYAAWTVALAVAVLSIWQLRRLRLRRQLFTE